MKPHERLLDGLQVWDRGWLSSTQVLLPAAPGEGGAVLFDSAHALHGEQTAALLQRALAGGRLRRVVNTHLHSDHCGGNALLRARFGAEVWVPPGQAQAVRDWQGLSHQQVGQVLPAFAVDGVLQPGQALRAGGCDWQALPAPGHDPHALMFWQPEAGVLIAGDALWERGFGVVFPELWGEAAFAEALAVLDAIEALAPRLLVPGHGPACHAVPAALTQARQRLQGWQADPRQHARHAARVLVKYHLMEVRRQPWAALLAWAEAVPLLATLWERLEPRPFATPHDWLAELVEGLARQGALRRQGDEVLDA